MRTFILRHGRTDYSEQYLVNGDPSHAVRLSEEGVRSCRNARFTLPLQGARTWLVSEFPRTRQTASLLMGAHASRLVVDARLNELDYGKFEGGPFLEYASWLDRHGGTQRPPGARESQREGVRRMLYGVRAALECPGPRVLVCHGLLVSVLLWHRGRSLGEAMPLFFPEAPYVEPLTVSDEALEAWVGTLRTDLDTPEPRNRDEHGDTAISRVGGESVIATFDRVDHSPEKKEPPHA